MPPSEIDAIAQHNCQFFSTVPADELRSWLLRSFADGHFAPLSLTPEPRPGKQIANIFASCSGQVQEKIKKALTRAVSEWRRNCHEFRARSLLISFCLRVRSISARMKDTGDCGQGEAP